MVDMTLKERIIELLTTSSRLTDREITNALFSKEHPQQSINKACRDLAAQGRIMRCVGDSKKIVNYIQDKNDSVFQVKQENHIVNSKSAVINKQYEIEVFKEELLKRVEIKFNKFGIENKFSELCNKSLSETIRNPRYLKFKSDVQSLYKNYLDMPIGEFLLMLKSKSDMYYTNFLNRNGDMEFCDFQIVSKEYLFKKGIYFYKYKDEILYIGRCRDSFKSRFNNGYGKISPKNCYLDGQSTNCHINSKVNKCGGMIEIYVLILQHDKNIVEIEKELIQKYKPEWNISLNTK